MQNMTNTILKWSIITGLFAVLFVPLYVGSMMFFPYITGKAFAFRIIVEIVAVLWFVLAIRDHSFFPKRSWIMIAAGVFVAIIGLADIFGVSPLKSFWSNYERMEGWVLLVHLFMYLVVLAGVFGHRIHTEGRKLWFWFAHTSLFASVIVGIIGFSSVFEKTGLWLAQKDMNGNVFHDLVINATTTSASFRALIEGVTRIESTLGNSTYVGVYALIHIFIVIFLLVKLVEASKIRKIKFFPEIVAGYILLFVFEFLLMFNTGTRGSLVGFGLALLFVTVTLAIFEKKSKALRIGSIVILALMVATFAAGNIFKNATFVTNSPLLSRFTQLATFDFKSVAETQGAARIGLWKMALQGAAERPVLGWGQENFNYVFNKHYQPSMYGQEQWFDRTHNVILDWLIAGGVLGLLGYLSLFAAILYYIWKPVARTEPHHDHSPTNFTLAEKAILTGLLIAYFVHNVFVFDNMVSYILFFSILAYVHSERSGDTMSWVKKLSVNKDIRDLIIIPVAAVVGIALIYYVNVRPLKANTALIKAYIACAQGKADVKLYNDALSIGAYEGQQEIHEQIYTCSESANRSQQVSPATKEALYVLTRAVIDNQIRATPNDTRIHYFAGLYLSTLRMWPEAISYLEKAVELSPKKQTILLPLASAYSASGQNDKAFAIIKSTYESEPKYLPGKSYYVAALIKQGNEKEAIALASTSPEFLESNEAINAYRSLKQYDKVIVIYNKRLANNPSDVQTILELAATYYMKGDKQASIRQLEKIATIQPDVKDQVDALVAKIRSGQPINVPGFN